MTSKKEEVPTRVITPVAMCSYPHLFEAWAGEDGQDPKFSIALVFSEEAQASPEYKAMKAAVLAAAEKKFPKKSVDMIRNGQLRLPFRDDAEDKGYPKGSTFANARSKDKPGVVSRHKDADGNAIVITKEEQVPGEPNDVYAGCMVRASLTAYGYDKAGNKGVAFGLNNVQKWAEGERIDNRMAAVQEFEADLEEPASSVADLL